MDFETLCQKHQEYFPHPPGADIKLLEKAYEFAKEAHKGQKRLSGDPFISHPLAVARILADLRLDSTSIAAGLLHDTLEDSETTFSDLKKEFGLEIAKLVNGVTKLGGVRLGESREEQFVENLRKMFLVMAKDIRVVLIKLADRLSNMQTLDALPKRDQKRIARTTLEIFAPLAQRLGMGEMKGDLEDLAFPYVYLKEYKWVKDLSAPYYKEADEYVVKAKKKVAEELKKAGIKVEPRGRAKHLYSLFRKLKRPDIGGDILKVYDLVALRIIVGSVEDCYKALGAIHKKWKPLPGRIKDYIALPKPNGYRSLHTTIFGPEKRILEIQIRDQKMHEEAETGVAAHWYYTDKKETAKYDDEYLEKGFVAPAKKLQWIKQLQRWQKEIHDSKEFLESLKIDVLSDRIFVLTPKGDVKDLPEGATPIDFAYAVHSDLGDKCVGAKVNGKLVSLDYKLQNNEVVEILTSKTKKHPSTDWLEFVKTQAARSKIRKTLRALS